MRSVWAVVCGTIRDQVDFSLIMDYLLKRRQEGVIQGIVLSTWEKELDPFPLLREKLAKNRVAVVVSHPNDDLVADMQSNSVNYWRQATQIQAALDIIPPEAIVLKTRTDRALPTTRRLIEMLDESDPLPLVTAQAEQRGMQAWPRVFEHKMAIFKARTGRVFQFADFSFMGYQRDIRKLLNFDVTEFYFKRGIVANTQFFIYPFIREYPVIRDYYRVVDFYPLLEDLQKYTSGGGKAFPEFLERVYAVYFGILATHFRIGHLLSREVLGQVDYPIEFSDFFHSSHGKFLAHDALGVTMNDQQILDAFLSQSAVTPMPVKKSKWRLSKKKQESHELPRPVEETTTRHVLQKIQDMTPDMFDQVTPAEIADMKTFTQDKTFSSHNWLRRSAPQLTEQSSEYSESMQYALPGISDDTRSQLWQRCEQNGNASRELFKFWMSENISPQDSAPYLLNSARTDNRFSIVTLTRLLRNGYLSETETSEILRINDFFSDFHMRHRHMNAEVACYTVAHYLYLVEKHLPIPTSTKRQLAYVFKRYFRGQADEFISLLADQAKLVAFFDNEIAYLTTEENWSRRQRVIEIALEVTNDDKYWKSLESSFNGKYINYEKTYRFAVDWQLIGMQADKSAK